MTDEELLAAAEAVLRDALEEAVFTQRPKDLDYAQVAANKVEGLRAKIAGRAACGVRLSLEGARVRVRYEPKEDVEDVE